MARFLARYAKFIVAALGAAAYATQAAISDGAVTGTEGGGILAAAFIAVFVLLVPNAPAPVRPYASDSEARVRRSTL